MKGIGDECISVSVGSALASLSRELRTPWTILRPGPEIAQPLHADSGTSGGSRDPHLNPKERTSE